MSLFRRRERGVDIRRLQLGHAPPPPTGIHMFKHEVSAYSLSEWNLCDFLLETFKYYDERSLKVLATIRNQLKPRSLIN